ncbi:metallophosphoesterase [Staphylococcus pseudintermedius]|nr:metallophosphoesterase [Staphylococcus pseudintermedius]
MNISYISDLHIDNWIKHNKNQIKHEKYVKDFVNKLIDKSNLKVKEVLVIAGDISHYNRITMWVLEEFSKQFEKVFFVSGNHDYYLVSQQQMKKYKNESKLRAKELSELVKQLDNVTFFNSMYSDNSEVYKGVTFAGATMTSLPATEEEISFYRGFMNDSKYITEEPKLYNTYDKVIYENILSEKVKPDVFISHYPLITTLSHRKHLNDGSIGSYKCEVGELIAPINFFGHVHEGNVMYRVVDTKHYCNALGYPNEIKNTIIRQIEV